MRVANWRAKEVFEAIGDSAVDALRAVMDDVVRSARAKAGAAFKYDWPERADGWQMANVSFTPKTGKNKNKGVSFTAKQWTGRRHGDLVSTIRRVERESRPGNQRVYAGNRKIYWAHMVEKSGYHDRSGQFHPPIPFLRNPFNAKKVSVIQELQDATRKTAERVG